MKKILTLMLLAVLAAACTKDADPRFELEPDEGALKIGLALASSPSPDDKIVIKIYKIAPAGSENAGERQLVRRYTSLGDVPQYLALVADDYCVTVDVGDDTVTASRTAKLYRGEQTFKVQAGLISNVTVDCKLRSTVVAVAYADSVGESLEEGYSTEIIAAESFDTPEDEIVPAPRMTFTQSGEGYFLMPQDVSTLSWRFEGVHPVEGSIAKSGTITDVKAGARYTVRLKYSKDANGMLVFTASVDETIEEFDDNISFSPDPTIMGEGFDTDIRYDYLSGSHTYVVSAQAAITQLKIAVGETVYDILSSSCPGVTVERTDDKNIRLTLADDFFAQLSGGVHSLLFKVVDADGGKIEKPVEYRTQGVNPLGDDDYDLWTGTASFTATVFDSSAASVAIAYREQGGEWRQTTAVAAGDGTYTASGTDFHAGKSYEYRLLLSSAQKGCSMTVAMPEGAQLPNGDMERWSKPDKAYFPYAQGDAPFWATGNPGSTSLGDKWNLTTPSTDIHAGSAGSQSAYLKATYPNAMGIGKFAAGNLFVGDFSLSGLDGMVDFGRPFEYTAKPKALKFWMKNNAGEINRNSGKPISGTDINQAVVILANWTKPRRVDTSNIDATFLDVENLDKEPGVVAYGVFRTQESAAEWYEKTIDLTYISDERPNYIVVSFATSAYGDYFCGSEDSYMYIDDVKLVY